jgi:hypothetical protein
MARLSRISTPAAQPEANRALVYRDVRRLLPPLAWPGFNHRSDKLFNQVSREIRMRSLTEKGAMLQGNQILRC